jgi:hypothetical protein
MERQTPHFATFSGLAAGIRFDRETEATVLWILMVVPIVQGMGATQFLAGRQEP